jgi:hypothetical protein
VFCHEDLIELTDRRWDQALVADPTSTEYGASETRMRGGGSRGVTG